MQTASLTGPDLAYWVARANLRGNTQDVNVVRRHYGDGNRNELSAEPSMRAFVNQKIGPVLPERRTWQ